MSSVANKIRHTAVDIKDTGKDKSDLVNFKMVTFSLAGKDYGIDIMKVKEIARFINFTYVPNTPGFVRGVYNLRGEIISIIDLRALFNLPFEQRGHNEEESGLILRLDSNLIGVVVDKIDKVVGINSGNIQPPHPIFGDINIKYISGVVENEGRLYIILDVERVLGKPEEKSVSPMPSIGIAAPDVLAAKSENENFSQYRQNGGSNDEEQYHRFIAEALQALATFTVSELNQKWFDARFVEWNEARTGQQVQLRSMDDAKAFLEPFFSPFTGQLWGEEYYLSTVDSLPDSLGPIIQVWNPGCGRGHESYSLAIALRTKYPEAQIKIWSSDKDLLNISGAPNLVFPEREIPNYCMPFMTQGKNGYSFSQKIKEMIMFEYHDITNNHALPPMDLVFARDVVSFMTLEQQKHFISEVEENLKKGGYVILGQNEIPPQYEGWETTFHQYMAVGSRV